MLLLLALAACSRGGTAASHETPVDAAKASDPRAPCGPLPCERFATAEDAFARVLETKPEVLAVGETHAQKELGVASSTKRFTEGLLPLVAPRATDLVLELWVANGSCAGKVEKVQKAQKEVTANQAPQDQNEFIALGDAAKRQGVEPHVLVPPCDDYARILDAGAGDVDAMLQMIARLSRVEVETLRARRMDAGRPGTVLVYGGAMHNDLEPGPGREAWSFGPALDKATSGRYVELDLVVPEAIKDTEAWRALPWMAHFDAQAHGKEALLITVHPRSFVLVFPRSR